VRPCKFLSDAIYLEFLPVFPTCIINKSVKKFHESHYIRVATVH